MIFMASPLDLPGAAYLECWGAYTIVQCRKVDRAAAPAQG